MKEIINSIVRVFVIVFFVTISTELNAIPLDSIYTNVDKLPAFKGKPGKINKFIVSKINYPKEAWLNCIEGTVQVSFVVTKDGTLMNVSIEEGVDPLLDLEAIRVVELMKEWKPAVKSKEQVHYRMTVSAPFFMSQEEKDFVETLKKHGLDKNQPLYVIDNKIVNTIIFIQSYNLKSMRILKGEKALEKYGEQGKNGVIEITTKRGTPPAVW